MKRNITYWFDFHDNFQFLEDQDEVSWRFLYQLVVGDESSSVQDNRIPLRYNLSFSLSIQVTEFVFSKSQREKKRSNNFKLINPYWQISETVLLENSSIKKSWVPIEFFEKPGSELDRFTGKLIQSSFWEFGGVTQAVLVENSSRPNVTYHMFQSKDSNGWVCQ